MGKNLRWDITHADIWKRVLKAEEPGHFSKAGAWPFEEQWVAWCSWSGLIGEEELKDEVRDEMEVRCRGGQVVEKAFCFGGL